MTLVPARNIMGSAGGAEQEKCGVPGGGKSGGGKSGGGDCCLAAQETKVNTGIAFSPLVEDETPQVKGNYMLTIFGVKIPISAQVKMLSDREESSPDRLTVDFTMGLESGALVPSVAPHRSELMNTMVLKLVVTPVFHGPALKGGPPKSLAEAFEAGLSPTFDVTVESSSNYSENDKTRHVEPAEDEIRNSPVENCQPEQVPVETVPSPVERSTEDSLDLIEATDNSIQNSLDKTEDVTVVQLTDEEIKYGGEDVGGTIAGEEEEVQKIPPPDVEEEEQQVEEDSSAVVVDMETTMCVPGFPLRRTENVVLSFPSPPALACTTALQHEVNNL